MENKVETAAPAASGPRGVVVTGGGTGIGRATAHAFADRGADVLVVGRSGTALKETAEGRPRIRTLAVDLTLPDAPGRVVTQALAELGRIDVLVNNAAAGGHGSLADTTPQQAENLLRINLVTPVLLTRAALDALEETRGTVVNISSSGSVGRRAWPDNSLYGASKSALDFLTRTWAVELAPRGIRVLGLAPGVIDTGIGLRMGMSPEAYDGFLAHMGSRTPAGRVGTAEEIAWWIIQLAEPAAVYATGTVPVVDGGLSLA
ncbi:SDR family oxidoreductase [Streptomyces cyaneofuscatus]|uniref:SDR family NAD(P)-dependent oxidoreductase n=1 Tax=Streptomyces cyaneofuscatus TaxID=66883 RepID=UPI0033A98907